jgi:Bacterial Ig-like domain
VRATDPVGNVDATPASRSFTVDTVAPQTTIDAGPPALTNDATPTFDFSADQAGSTYECRVDGGAWAACSPGHTSPALADGAHVFEVRATDSAGNVDATPAVRAFVVETSLPDTTIDAGPSGTTTDSTPSFDFSADEPGSTYECRVDGGAWASCSSGWTATTLTDGSHTFEVRATDDAGNVDPTPASRTFTVATAAPAGTDGGGTSGGGGQTGNANVPPPAFTPSAPSSDLHALAGSLVGERSCQRLGAGLRTKRMKVRGIGRVTVRIKAPAIVMADDPLTVGVTGPKAGKGRLRSVRYTLDGRGLRASGKPTFTAQIKPASLARVGRHALTLKLKPKRGRPATVKLGMRTFPCKTVFRAYQKRAGKGGQLKLRIDARDAVSGATFSVPRKMLPKGKAGLKVGTIRVVSASSASRSWNLAFAAQPASQILAGAAGTPSVSVSGGKVTVTGLPAGTGIVEVFLNVKRAALVKRGRSAGVSATVTGASSQRLSFKLRG